MAQLPPGAELLTPDHPDYYGAGFSPDVAPAQTQFADPADRLPSEILNDLPPDVQESRFTTPARKFDEQQFQSWYRNIAQANGLDQNPDAPEHKYDYRKAYTYGAQPDSETGHWPSEFKHGDHPNRFVFDDQTGDLIDTIDGSVLRKERDVGAPATDAQFFGLDNLPPPPVQLSREDLVAQQQALAAHQSDQEGRGFFSNLGRGIAQAAPALERQAAGFSALTGQHEADFWLNDAAQRAQPYAEDASVVQDLAANVVSSLVPAVGGAVVGGAFARNPKAGAAIAMAMQAAGSTQADAEDAYREQGMSPEEARHAARWPALLTGVVTGALMHYLPNASTGLAEKLFSGSVPRGTLQAVITQSVREIGRNMPEAMVQQLSSEIIAKGTYEPDKPLHDIVLDVVNAGGIAAIMSGASALPGVASAALRGERSGISPELLTADEAARTAANPELAQQSLTPTEYGRIQGRRQATQARLRRAMASEPQISPPAVALAAVEGGVTPEINQETGGQGRQEGVLTPTPINAGAEPIAAPASSPTPEARAPVVKAVDPEVLQAFSTRLSQKTGAQVQIMGDPQGIRIANIAVDPSQQGQSSETLTQIKAFARDKQTPVVVTAQAEPGQAEALAAFYERNGFVRTGRDEQTGAAHYEFRPQPPATEAMPGAPAFEPPYNTQATGQKAIRELIAKNPGIDEVSRRAYLAMADSPLLKGADFQNLLLRFTNDMPENALAAADPSAMMVRLRNGIDRPDALAHEVFHIVHDLLSANLRADVNTARLEALRQQFGDISSLPKEILDGTATSAAFDSVMAKAGVPKDFHADLYNMRSSGEYLTKLFGDRQARESLPKGVFERITDYLKGVVQAVREAFGAKSPEATKMDALYNDLMAGRVPLSRGPDAQTVELHRGLINGSPAQSWATRTLAESRSEFMRRPSEVPPDSEVIDAYAVHGAAVMERGVVAPADFTREMQAKFGDGIKSFMDAIAERSRQLASMTPEERTAAVNFDGNPFAYSAHPEDAQNHMSLAPERKRQAVADQQMAQGVDITKFLDQHGALANPAVASILDAGRWRGIADIGEAGSAVGRQGYREVMARTPNIYDRRKISRVTAAHLNTFSDSLEAAKTDGAQAAERMASPAFIERTARLQRTLEARDFARANHDATQSILRSAAAEAEKALKDSTKSDIEVSRLQSVLRGIQDAQNSAEANRQLADRVVSVLSSTPEGFAALYGEGSPTPAKLRAIFTDLSASVGQAAPDANLLKWVTYTLAKSKTVRDNLLAAHLARDASVSQNLAPFQARLATDFKTDPAGTMARLMRHERQLTTREERTQFVWKQLNAEHIKDYQDLLARSEAGRVAGAVLDNPEFKAFRAEVAKDAEQVGRRAHWKFGDDTYVLPDGSEVQLAPKYMTGGDEWLTGQRAHIEKSVAAMEDWLRDPANATNDNYSIYEHDLAAIKEHFLGLETLSPTTRNTVWRKAFTILDNVIRQTGGRLQPIGHAAVRGWNEMKIAASDWSERTTNKFAKTRTAALKSHEIRYGFFGDDLTDANARWLKLGGNELIASHDGTGKGYQVGDRIGPDFVVTPEDMADVRAQAESARMLFTRANKIEQAHATDSLANTSTAIRRPQAAGPNMTPRLFADNVRDALASPTPSNPESSFRAAYKRYAANPSDAHANELTGFFNRAWHLIGDSLVKDRRSQFAQNTMFDGPGGGFEAAKKAVTERHGAINSVGDLVDFLANEANTAATPDEARRIVLDEFGRIVNQFMIAAEKHKADPTIKIHAAEAANAFSKSRDQLVAPYAFYKNGFHVKEDIENLASAAWARPVQRVVEYLKAADADVSRQLAALKTRVDALKALGNSDSKALFTAMQENEIALQAGRTHDEYDALKTKQSMIRAALADLLLENHVADSDVSFTRTLNALTTSLVATFKSTSQNVSSGPRFVGRTLISLGMGPIKAYTLAYLDGFLKQSLLKFGPSFALSAIKSPFLAGAGGLKGLGKLLTDADRRSLAHVWESTLSPVIREFSETMMDRVADSRRLHEEGLVPRNDRTGQFATQVLASMIYKNGPSSRKFTNFSKIKQSPAALMEVTSTALLAAMHPLGGDAAVNASTASTVGWWTSQIEKKLLKVYSDYRNGGYRQFDFNDVRSPANALSAKEMGMASNEFSRMKQEFMVAGVPFPERAAAFLRDVHNEVGGDLNWKQSGRKLASEFMTQADQNQIVSHAISQTNRAVPSNSPLAFNRRDIQTIITKPFVPWKLRQFSQFLNNISVPRSAGQEFTPQQLRLYKTKIWAAATASTVIGLLGVGAASTQLDELWARKLRLAVYNQINSSRLPIEYDSPNRKVLSWADYALQSVPVLGWISTLIANDIPARASNDPTLVAVEMAKGIGQYIGGALSTHDVTYGLPQLIQRLVPESAIVMNRLESQEGKRERANAVNILRREAPEELLKPPYKGGLGGNVTELSPFIPRMENAAYNGDQAGFTAAYNEAVAKATELGKPNPEKLVNQMWQARNPYNAALTQRMTPEQRQTLLDRLSPGDRQAVEGAEQKFAAADSWLGLKAPTYERAARQGSSGPASGSALQSAGPSAGLPQSRSQSVIGGASGLSRAAGPAGLASSMSTRLKRGRSRSSGVSRIKGGSRTRQGRQRRAKIRRIR